MKSLEQLASEEKNYLPNDKVRGELAYIPLVCVVGGVGVGKNYLMQRTGLPIVGRITTRPARASDDPKVYTYYTNEEFAKMIELHELVQYAVDLPNNAIYGSMLENYVANTPNLADIWHWSVAELPDKGFRSVRAVSIITPLKQWREQMELRFADRDENYRLSRRAEARKSLLWTREQIVSKNPDHTVIINDKNRTGESVERMRDFASGNNLETPANALILIDELTKHLQSFTPEQ